MSASQSEATKKQEEIDRLEAMISRELFERHPDELEADSRLQRAVYAQDTLVASSFFLPRRRRGGVDERGHQEAAFVAHQGSLKLRPDVDFGEVCYTEEDEVPDVFALKKWSERPRTDYELSFCKTLGCTAPEKAVQSTTGYCRECQEAKEEVTRRQIEEQMKRMREAELAASSKGHGRTER
mmetsp:Transcript_6538/g.15006  ORF Transcript_6538/g.15006 Transcript_6538/m.15006 type:complete len:182 (-) Transcript_6538:267-812(-)